MKKLFAIVVASMLLVTVSAVVASPPSSFNADKRIAEQQIYHDQNESFSTAAVRLILVLGQI
ncbi:hypothetical protein K7H09_19360 [Halomonas sp. IOP_14]|uniref:hypothetical protein n=1 Tax=Halomonas sp. IOP_14 TaxID=2873295 RepID=UPI001E64C715|nr:hypothetical protein [Halomonas sp. IOP_14]MCD1588164.1 hypothetical protein [Halomonas sp. IOP_14]